ncbi:MAG: hypothetical protein LKF74_02945 [Megasphaera sp.]|jgi:hypothetical protein|nr:hypothetical protein [Megasphaera sp.]MCH4217502.1 hypothetical protein [Megasphaera sp.]
MKSSWRTLILALVLGASATLAQAADYSVWHDSHYTFRPNQTLYAATLDMSDVKLDSSIKERVLQEYYVQKSKTVKTKKIITEPIPTVDATLPTAPGSVEAAHVTSPNPAVATTTATAATPVTVPAKEAAVTEQADTVTIPQAAIDAKADLYVTAKVLKYIVTSYLVPAHTEWKSREITDYYYDKNGHSHSYTHNVDYPEYVPDTYYPRAIVHVHFHMYDTKTGKLVAAIEDDRTRDGSDDATSMYKRIVDRFFKNLTAWDVDTAQK